MEKPMLEYWMGNNESSINGSEFEIKEVLEDPGSAILFVGYPSGLLCFAAGCCVLFMLIGIPGNLITVAALFRTKKLRNATAVFIMNLSVSDLMFCCFNLPLATSTFWQSSWTHGPLLCRLFPLLRYGLVAVSLFTVLAITINRYVMIGHPRLYPKLYKPKYLILMVLATWISGFGALVATWFEQWGRFGLDPVIGSCSILPDVNGRSPKEFLFILAFFAPCIAIIVCYARIFYIVRKTALKSRRREKVTSDLVKASIEIKYTRSCEDSAIGSSCGGTFAGVENGGSPINYQVRKDFDTSSSSNITNNRRRNDRLIGDDDSSQVVGSVAKKLWSLKKSRSEESHREDSSEERRSPNEGEKSEASSENDRTESISSAIIKNGTIDNNDNLSATDNADPDRNDEKFENNITVVFDNDEPRLNFERSVQFIPFIDTGTEQQSADPGIVKTIGSFENPENQSSTEKKYRKDSRLKVPERFSRFTDQSIDHRAVERPKGSCREIAQILDTKSLENKDEKDVALTKQFLRELDDNSSKLLSPRSIKQCRYNAELSDEYASSRSDSLSERRESPRKTSIFRRESRFRSMRNRAFESGKMTAKDKKLLKMILVIFSSFLICYLPITITKTFKDVIDWRGLNIAGYILIYLTTCINPVIYVVMSSEYRCAYKNVILCRSDSTGSNCKPTVGKVTTGVRVKRKKNRARKKEIIN